MHLFQHICFDIFLRYYQEFPYVFFKLFRSYKNFMLPHKHKNYNNNRCVFHEFFHLFFPTLLCLKYLLLQCNSESVQELYNKQANFLYPHPIRLTDICFKTFKIYIKRICLKFIQFILFYFFPNINFIMSDTGRNSKFFITSCVGFKNPPFFKAICKSKCVRGYLC